MHGFQHVSQKFCNSPSLIIQIEFQKKEFSQLVSKLALQKFWVRKNVFD